LPRKSEGFLKMKTYSKITDQFNQNVGKPIDILFMVPANVSEKENEKVDLKTKIKNESRKYNNKV
jgi:hypothetical protein